MLHISHPTRSIAAPFEPQLGTLFPHGQRFDYEGVEMILIPHGLDETKLLRNLGHTALPSPIEEHYDFPSIDGKKAFAKQVATTVLMTMNPHCYVLNGMGTGKTKACIWSYHFLKSIGKAKSMLVTCPLSTMRFTWEREIFNTIPGLKVQVLSGSAERRKKLLAEKADIYVINHDGVRVVYKELMARPDINVICFDEAAAYRNARSDRAKMARALSKGRDFIWAMTGSPTPSEPTDAFGLAALVTPETAPRSFVQFRADTMIQINQFTWKPKRNAAEIVARVLTPAVRFTLDEIVELPPVIEHEIEVPMGKDQGKTYKMLKDHAAALLKEGTITAVNGGVCYSKMLQTSIGWVYGDDGNTYSLDNHDRIAALMDIVEGNIDSTRPDGKIIIFSPYISSMEGVAAALARHKISFAKVSGATPHGERNDIFQAFQHGEKLRVLCAHPECMSHGLTLTAADTIVWFGPTTKLETYEQANARIRRIGQTRKQQIIRLVSSEAERVAYRRLAAKQDLQNNVLSIIAELTEE
jgi:SNF2 family DNA or RNA helicase